MGGTLQGRGPLSGTRGTVTWVCRAQGGTILGPEPLEVSLYGEVKGNGSPKRVTGTKARAVLRITYSKECLGAGPIYIQYRNSLDPNRPKDVGVREGWWTQLWG